MSPAATKSLTFASVAAAAIPPLLYAHLIATTGANAHSNDYLGWLSIVEQINGGNYVWSHYLKDTLQAGVHSFAIPILFTAAVARWAEWSIDVTLYLTLAMSVLKLLLLHDALSRGLVPWVRQALLVALSCLLFSPAHVNVFTFGFTASHVALTELGFALAIWGVVRFPGRNLGLGISCAGAWLATWSWGSGLICWPILAVAMPLLGLRKRSHFVVLGVCFAASALPYLLYGNPGLHSGPTYAFQTPRRWLGLEATGWLFSGPYDHWRARLAGVFGLAFTGAAAWWLKKGPRERWSRAAASLMLLAYGFGLMFPVVVIRGQLSSWYTTTFGFIWVGLAGLVALALEKGLPADRDERLACGSFALVTGVLFAVNGGYADKIYYLKTRGPGAASCLRHGHNAPPICEKAVFQWQGGHPEEVDAMATVLERNGWGAFARDQVWTLQGDYLLETVSLERAPGSSEIVWTPGLVPELSPPIDYRHLNLFLRAPGAIHWKLTLPAGTQSATLETAVALSDAANPEARSASASFEVLAGDEVIAHRAVAPNETGWAEVALPLERFAGKQVVLTLRTSAEGAAHPWAMYRYPAIHLTLKPGEKYLAPQLDPPPRTLEDVAFDLTDATRWKSGAMTPVEGAPSRWWVQPDPQTTYQKPLDMCLDDYALLLVTAFTSPNCVFRNMQIFYRLDTDPGFSEAHSIWIPLYPGTSRSYLYSLKLLGVPQAARLTGLRVDPIVGPEGEAPTWIELPEVRFVRLSTGPSRCAPR